MELMEAIDARISCRSYQDRPMDDALFARLKDYIAELNSESGLNFQLYGPREGGQPAIEMNDKMFAGPVYCYAALVAPDDAVSGEKVGYYGEKLVLFATQLGLGTCWVASTYDAASTRADVAEGERLWEVVPLGHATEKTPLKQRMIRSGIRKSDKKPAALVESDIPFDDLPVWLKAGIDAVIAGPSAVNGQPVVFSYRNGRVSADLPKYKRIIEYNDLGIAKLHFQIAASAHGVDGTWDWGVGGQFNFA